MFLTIAFTSTSAFLLQSNFYICGYSVNVLFTYCVEGDMQIRQFLHPISKRKRQKNNSKSRLWELWLVCATLKSRILT